MDRRKRRSGTFSTKEDYRTDVARRLAQAQNLFTQGKVSAAEQAYKHFLQDEPGHFQAHCLLAQLYCNSGRTVDAIDQLHEAIRVAPQEASPWYNLGLIYKNQSALDKALSCFQQAIKLKPDFAEAYALRGVALRRAGRTNEAIDDYRRAIALNPEAVDIHYNLVYALYDLGRFREAIDQYRHVLSIRPDYVDAYHGMGLCLDRLGDLDGSVASYEQGLKWDQSHAGIWNNTAQLYLAQNRLQNAFAAYRTSANLQYNHGRPIKGPLYAFLHRIRHDAEQLRYLLETGALSAEHRDYLAALSEIESVQSGKPGTEKILVDAHTVQRIAPSFNRIIHYAECPRIHSGALNPEVDWSACESAYKASTPEVVVIDSFLCPEAIRSLRRFCLESTVWKTVRPYGYLGTMIDGFASPLLLQITLELREKLPGILAPHYLTQAWAYKYDNSLRGINTHADCAAVNINFWITPDQANKNPASGGLVIWDKLPPSDWGLMRAQNPDKTEINRYLETSGARALEIPYRQNRMVMFNSGLFHKSGETEFRDGYENRRINVTLLYGSGLGQIPQSANVSG